MFESRIIKEKQDLTYLKWSHVRSSSGTAGTFLKSESIIDGKKIYYKLSNIDPVNGVIGHECVNELIVDRLLTLLGVEHLSYELIHADIDIEGRIYNTWLCASEDFKKPGESKTALDNYYRTNALKGESRLDFCRRMGWTDYVVTMLAVDYIILNRDRHGANIEVLRNTRAHTFRIAPLFDHGLSLLYSCLNEKDIKAFDVMVDRPCQNFLGSRSCLENLDLISRKGDVFPNKLKESDKSILLNDLDGIIPSILAEKIWEMIYRRYLTYESIRNS